MDEPRNEIGEENGEIETACRRVDRRTSWVRPYAASSRALVNRSFSRENRREWPSAWDGREQKNRRLGAGLSELDYPEAEATVPIHPETPTSGHIAYCILLAKSAVTAKYNEYNYFH
jgi:hypothetical protein